MVDAHGLGFATLAPHQGDVATRDSESAGEELEHVFVGGPIDRRGGDAQLQAVAVGASKGVVAGARLYTDV